LSFSGFAFEDSDDESHRGAGKCLLRDVVGRAFRIYRPARMFPKIRTVPTVDSVAQSDHSFCHSPDLRIEDGGDEFIAARSFEGRLRRPPQDDEFVSNSKRVTLRCERSEPRRAARLALQNDELVS